MSVSKINFNDKNEAYIIVDPISDIDKNDFKKYLDLDSPSFLNCEFENDKVFTLFYSYNNNVTLKAFISQTINKNQAITFLKSLTKAFIEAEENGMNLNHILLGVNSVFCNPKTTEVSCIYVPVAEGVLPAHPLRLFLKEVLVNMIYSEEDNMEWLGNIIRYINKNRKFNHKDFYTFLQSIDQKSNSEAEKVSVSPEISKTSAVTEIQIEKEIKSVYEITDPVKPEPQAAPETSYYLYRRSDHSMYILGKKDMRIGKSMDNEISIQDNPVISRVHAIISYIDGEYVIQDNGSTNRTFVNGFVLNPDHVKVLSANDRILLGNEEFIFKVQ